MSLRQTAQLALSKPSVPVAVSQNTAAITEYHPVGLRGLSATAAVVWNSIHWILLCLLV